ncbi:MAG TPA: DUF6520 family protein [Chitinophagaceae bacterium]|nr:DUF6520 family protein [Chitinophagaceae bacterium]
MKKMMIVPIAVIAAIVFSAFTPLENKSAAAVVTYQDEDGNWHNFTGTPCPGTQIPECIRLTPHGLQQLFYDNDITKPVKRNAP